MRGCVESWATWPQVVPSIVVAPKPIIRLGSPLLLSDGSIASAPLFATGRFVESIVVESFVESLAVNREAV